MKAATGEVVSAEELGGADVHTRASPASPTTTPQNDAHALAIARSIVGQPEPREARRTRCCASRASRCIRAEELYGIIPADTRKPYDVREIIARLRRRQRVRRVQAALRHHAGLTGFAHLHGYPVGILANNGILFSESALKGAHFIELCCQRGIPLLFLQNITGFMVGKKYEAGGIAKDGAKMVTAVACARVPKFTRDHRRQLRRRQLRHVRPRLLAALPVDVAERAHLGHGRRAGGHRAGDGQARRHRSQGRQLERGRGGGVQAPIREQYEQQGHPYYASARLWDDGVIDPADTPAGARPRPLGGAQRADRGDAVRRVQDVNGHD